MPTGIYLTSPILPICQRIEKEKVRCVFDHVARAFSTTRLQNRLSTNDGFLFSMRMSKSVISHVGWGGERNTLYKGVKTSL